MGTRQLLERLNRLLSCLYWYILYNPGFCKTQPDMPIVWEVRATSKQTFVLGLLISFHKLLYDCVEYPLQKNHFKQQQWPKKQWSSFETLFLCFGTISMSFKMYFLDCPWKIVFTECFFRQLVISLTLKNLENIRSPSLKTPKIILGKGLLNTKVTPSVCYRISP